MAQSTHPLHPQLQQTFREKGARLKRDAPSSTAGRRSPAWDRGTSFPPPTTLRANDATFSTHRRCPPGCTDSSWRAPAWGQFRPRSLRPWRAEGVLAASSPLSSANPCNHLIRQISSANAPWMWWRHRLPSISLAPRIMSQGRKPQPPRAFRRTSATRLSPRGGTTPGRNTPGALANEHVAGGTSPRPHSQRSLALPTTCGAPLVQA